MATGCYTSKIEPKEMLFASLQICAFVQFQPNLCTKVMLSWYCTDRKYNKNVIQYHTRDVLQKVPKTSQKKNYLNKHMIRVIKPVK